MDDLINRKELKKDLSALPSDTAKKLLDNVLKCIRDARTIEAEPVVHCKDCKYRIMNYAEYAVKPWITCRRIDFKVEIQVDEDFYCGYGANMDKGGE